MWRLAVWNRSSDHSKIHVADFTFMVRRINENRHTLSAYVFLRWFHDSDHWFYVSGAFYLKNNFWPARDSNPRPLRTLFSIKTPNRNQAFSAMPLLENVLNNYQDKYYYGFDRFRKTWGVCFGRRKISDMVFWVREDEKLQITLITL
jgi:hypothetical protein